MNDRITDAAAGSAAVGGWVLFGISLAQAIQVLQIISLIAATACSVAAYIYYRKKTPR